VAEVGGGEDERNDRNLRKILGNLRHLVTAGKINGHSATIKTSCSRPLMIRTGHTRFGARPYAPSIVPTLNARNTSMQNGLATHSPPLVTYTAPASKSKLQRPQSTCRQTRHVSRINPMMAQTARTPGVYRKASADASGAGAGMGAEGTIQLTLLGRSTGHCFVQRRFRSRLWLALRLPCRPGLCGRSTNTAMIISINHSVILNVFLRDLTY
jgi:hypothetical protein